jgi:hypothetical protein
MKHARNDYERIQDPAGLIPVDEPVFLIRAKGEVGPLTVDKWADYAEQAGADHEIISHARNHAQLMRKWQREHGAKFPTCHRDAGGEKE